MEKHTYQYKRLESKDHIRVLILDPSQDPSAPLQCSIKQQELETMEEPYECISYTWGGQTLAHDLYCDDGSIVEITANLHSALSRFRSNSRSRCLWADAVCINQADSEEKSEQIPLMPRIYRNASRVLVWLGSGIDGEGETMRSLVRLGRQLDRLSFDSRQDQETVQRVESQLSEAQESIRKFFQLPWFGRRWVVQEAVLNPDVVFFCGLTEISWPRLYLAFEALPDYIWNDNSGSRVHKSLQKLGDLWRAYSYLSRKAVSSELFDLLDSFYHLECQEVKDRIYALAGLASDVRTSTALTPLRSNQEKMTLIPDYSLSDDEVFRQVALRRIQSGRAFTTLAYAGALRPRNGSRTLPSWIPDFRLSKLWLTILVEPDSKHQPRIELRSDGSLALSGKVVTKYSVQDIFPGPTDSEPRSMFQFVCDSLFWMHSSPIFRHLRGDSKKIRLCDGLLTLAAQLGKEEYEMTDSISDSFKRLPSNSSKAEGPDETVKSLLISLLDDPGGNNERFDRIIPYLSVLFKAMIGRRLCLSNGVESLGIGPGDIVAGDVSVRFAGVEQSLFLRPEQGKHQVLGDGISAVLGPWRDVQTPIYNTNTAEEEILLV
ncbi:Heterokaryon incompatibility protein (HET) domain containing protein [Hyaloscypha variabilis]